MGKQTGKKKKQEMGKSSEENVKNIKVVDSKSPRAYDKDTAVFISMSQELKEAGNQHFQKRDYEGAMLKYEKAIKLLPRNHIDVSYLRSNMAACHMQMGITEYPRAIHECNLALEVTPKYSKALLKRAKCYEALNRLDLAMRDVNTVSTTEPNNLMALEIGDRVKKLIEKKGIVVDEKPIDLATEFIDSPCEFPVKTVKSKARRKRIKKVEEKKAEDKVVVEEKISTFMEEEPKKTVKLVFGEDIRWAQLPINCNLFHLREVISDRFPSSKAVLIKYRDPEGDLVTITTNDEMRLAETTGESQGSLRLYVVEVSPEQDPFFERIATHKFNQSTASENGSVGKLGIEKVSSYIDDWIIQFAQLFKNHVGFESDTYMGLHELGMKLYSEAMEETVTSEEAQDLFDAAAKKFQEMAALALFNWGNVHMSKARKKVYFTEDSSKESQLEQLKTAYDWAQIEYSEAGKRYEESLQVKQDFHEAILALGQQQFEQAKLSWYYAIGNNVDLETWPSTEVLELYNNAENNMEKGMQMWEQFEVQRINDLSKPNKIKTQLQKMGLEGLFKDMLVDEASDQASNMRSQINLLWGTILYERSIMEYKLELPVWNECLDVSIDKFELAGASATDIGVMVKNHCSNNNALEGFGFKMDEIIQAWNEMYEAKRWQRGVPSFRLEPLFCRRVPPIYHALEHA